MEILNVYLKLILINEFLKYVSQFSMLSLKTEDHCSNLNKCCDLLIELGMFHRNHYLKYCFDVFVILPGAMLCILLLIFCSV